jgi:hypothetical protein
MTACAIAVHGLLDQRLDQRLDRLGAAVPDRQGLEHLECGQRKQDVDQVRAIAATIVP